MIPGGDLPTGFSLFLLKITTKYFNNCKTLEIHTVKIKVNYILRILKLIKHFGSFE